MHKKISYGGIGTAISVLLMFLAVYAPSGKIALVFCTSLISYIISLEMDKKTAVIMFFSSSVISFLLLFGSSPVIVTAYILCFGNYPVIKTFFDKKSLAFQLASKLIMYSIYASSMYLIVEFMLNIRVPYSMIMLYIIGVFVFGAYDYLLSYTGEYFRALLHKNKS